MQDIPPSVFHEGELAVQACAGVRAGAERVGRIIHDAIPEAAARFLQERPFAVVAAMQAERMWAGLFIGSLRTRDEGRILDMQGRLDGDALGDLHVESTEVAVGVLAIDPDTRRRFRVNGRAHASADGLRVEVEQAYSNCPQHITPRAAPTEALSRRAVASRSASLDEGQRHWLEEADTFYVATRHPTRGADASHRGGSLRVPDSVTLEWDDYDGNMMFNTLGNLAVDARAGVTVIDFERARTLQMSGRMEVRWTDGGRVLRFTVEEIVQAE